MTSFGIFYIILGSIYSVYVYVKREKITFYFKRRFTTIVDDVGYKQLQLSVSLLNAVYLILFGITIQIFDFNTVTILAGLIPFHLINIAIVSIARQRGYIEMN